MSQSYNGYAGTSAQSSSSFATYPQYNQYQQPPPQQQQQAASNVEWYAPAGVTGPSQYNPADYQTYSQQQYSNADSGAAYGSFEDDAPLLEELGIDVPAIMHRIKAILTFRFHSTDADSLDLGGPIIFMAILAIAHLMVGKLHFGYILGWTVVGSVLLWFILSSVAEGDDTVEKEDNRLDLYSTCSIIGYSLLPLVGHALVSLLLPRRSIATLILGGLAVLWAAYTATRLFMLRSRGLHGQKMVVLYPCILMYTSFALLTLY
jgi:hypothetical protein